MKPKFLRAALAIGSFFVLTASPALARTAIQQNEGQMKVQGQIGEPKVEESIIEERIVEEPPEKEPPNRLPQTNSETSRRLPVIGMVLVIISLATLRSRHKKNNTSKM
ncbi:hypothetical protein [Enterococcus casseliflavus]|uniref:hypothetical protein n=1 Tax=Enterococcus casseliflavus TaxID=37734 RepID=UPI0011A9FEC4|nr:hypothetical protein [Enterococcus casseliflavus]